MEGTCVVSGIFKRQLLDYSDLESVLKVVLGIPGFKPQMRLAEPSTVIRLWEGASPSCGERLGSLLACIVVLTVLALEVSRCGVATCSWVSCRSAPWKL